MGNSRGQRDLGNPMDAEQGTCGHAKGWGRSPSGLPFRILEM